MHAVDALLQLLARQGGMLQGGNLSQADELGAQLLDGVVEGLPLVVEYGARHAGWLGVAIQLDGDIARLKEEADAGEPVAVEICTAEKGSIRGAGKLEHAILDIGLAQNLLGWVFECQSDGVAIVQLGRATIYLINIRLAGAQHKAGYYQSEKVLIIHLLIRCTSR